jgi:hypothetical protein
MEPMRVTRRFMLALLPAALQAQRAARSPTPAQPPVEIRGRIARVNAGPAEGMPSLEVEVDGRVWRVWLGSLRYLIENDFNPRAGQLVIVRGIRPGADREEAWAVAVTLVEQKRTLRLRDESGRPLWRGRKGRRGRAPGKSW